MRDSAEPQVVHAGSAALPTEFSPTPMRMHAFVAADGVEHLAIVSAPWPDIPLVRVHSECLTGDALGSLRCDCGAQLRQAMQLVGEAGGIVVYLRGHEGRGIGLANKVRAYARQDAGEDTVTANIGLGLPADGRDYAAAADILTWFDIGTIDLLTNNPAKIVALGLHGIAVRQQRPLIVPPNRFNLDYLMTKQARLGHGLQLPKT